MYIEEQYSADVGNDVDAAKNQRNNSSKSPTRKAELDPCYISEQHKIMDTGACFSEKYSFSFLET